MKLDDYRLLGRSGLRVSPLCLGTMTFGTAWGWGAPPEECRALVQSYLELGGNFIDTANKYTEGAAEQIVGGLIADCRDFVVLSTKYTLSMRTRDPNAAGNHRKNLVQSLEASLKRLQTDRVDLYWVHAWDGLTPIDEVMRALDDLVRMGKVLYIGVSDTPAWKVAQGNTLAELRAWASFVGLQVEYNLIERTPERDLIPMARELGLGVMPWSPLAGGLLTGKHSGDSAKGDSLRSQIVEGRLDERSARVVAAVVQASAECGASPAQVALRWVIERPGVASVLLGARTSAQLIDNLACLDLRLTDRHRATLDEASQIDLGFPHTFLASDAVQKLVTGEVKITARP